ncbi:MAG: type II secretion system F family protein [Actinomycetia bacterium]|nr:type II secretion system F family protein [Actinomycetes bacterium]
MQNIYFYIMLGSVFLSVFLIILFSGMPKIVKPTDKKRMDKLDYYQMPYSREEKKIPSFMERVVLPFFGKIAAVTKRLSPSNIVENTRRKLELAGAYERISVDMYLAIKLLFPVGIFFLDIIIFIFFPTSLLVKIILLAFIPISYFFPDIYMSSKISGRQTEIRKTLPNALDLLTISVEAGMGFDHALARVAGNIKGSLGDELNKMLHEIQLGFSRKDAFRNLNRRTEVEDLNTFIVLMIQAETFGISVGKVLRVQANEMRTKRRQRAEEAGAKAPVKLVFPLIFCLFPALMTVIIGPAVIRILGVLAQMSSP